METSAITSEIKEVTPELAREWLDHNTNNRTLRRDTVTRYANDMSAGNWSLVGDSICFDESGNLINGQHRLNAVIQSDTTQLFNIMTGLAHNKNMDRGLGRTVADNVKIFSELPEICSKRLVISTMNFILKELKFDIRTVSTVYDFMKEYEEQIQNFWREVGFGRYIRKGKYTRGCTIAGFFLAYINGVSPEILQCIKGALETGMYAYPGYDYNRFLPAFKLERECADECPQTQVKRVENFLKVQTVINAIANNRQINTETIPVRREIFYDIEYKGRTLSNCITPGHILGR